VHIQERVWCESCLTPACSGPAPAGFARLRGPLNLSVGPLETSMWSFLRDSTMASFRPDGSYALASVDEQARRRANLRLPHVAPLTAFVEEVRAERGLGAKIPFFDPRDGGIRADALFLLEAPGPNALASGFVSRDNPDPSARNLRALLAAADIPRERTILWNIVPWYIGTGTKIRAATSADIKAGVAFLPRLLTLLVRLRVVVLVGRKAQRAREVVANLTRARIFNTLHPSNQVVTCWPERRMELQRELHAVAACLAHGR
jgi:uracil-DNA glycosylase